MPFKFGLNPLLPLMLLSQWRTSQYAQKVIFFLSALFIGCMVALNLAVPITLDSLKEKLLAHQLSEVPVLTLTSDRPRPWRVLPNEKLQSFSRLSEKPWYPLVTSDLILVTDGTPTLVRANSEFSDLGPNPLLQRIGPTAFANVPGISIHPNLACQLKLKKGQLVRIYAAKSISGELHLSKPIELPVVSFHTSLYRGVHYSIGIPHDIFAQLTETDPDQVRQWSCSTLPFSQKNLNQLTINPGEMRGWQCHTWMNQFPTLARAMQIETLIIRILIATMMLLSVLGLSTLTNLFILKDAKRFILLRALGARQSQIWIIAYAELALPNIIGCLFAIPCTIILLHGIPYALELHCALGINAQTIWNQRTAGYWGLPLTLLFFNQVLFALYPVWQLSRLPPDPIFEE